MDLFSTFDGTDFTYTLITVFISVVLVLLIRHFGNLPVTLFGVDFNLLTYGYLWDTTTKALRGNAYWPRFHGAPFNMNKPTMLLVVCLANLLLLAWNMKILDKIEANSKANTPGGYMNWILRPVAITFGLTGLVAFVVFNSVWG